MDPTKSSGLRAPTMSYFMYDCAMSQGGARETRVVFRPFAPAMHLETSVMPSVHRRISNFARTFLKEFNKNLHRITRL